MEFILILLGATIVAGVIAAITKIVKSERPTSAKVIWIALLVFPYTAGIVAIVFWIMYFLSQKEKVGEVR